MKWSKVLTATDAQQPTKGRRVPYLRFIRGRNPHNNQTWFRNTFFNGQNWTPGRFGEHAVEQCTVPIEVSIAGVLKGTRSFVVTHDSNRMGNNNTPNTWLHYDPATLSDFGQANLQGRTVVLERTPAAYQLTIS